MAKHIPEFKGTIVSGISESIVSKSKSKIGTGERKNEDRNLDKETARHEEAERKRQESMKRQRESFFQKRNTVSNALKSIDHSGQAVQQNKKTKFASSSSSSSSSDEEPEAKKPTKTTKEKSNGNSSTAVSNDKKQLFDEDDNEDDANFEFSSAKFDGVTGAKLLELQSKQGGIDPRFRMDARFLDDADDDTIESKDKTGQNEIIDEDVQLLKQERRANRRILEKVLGKSLDKNGDDETTEAKSKFVPYLRYDPENPNHRQFQVTNDDSEDDGKMAKASSSPTSSEESENDDGGEIIDHKTIDVPIGLDPEFAASLRRKQAERKTENGEKTEPTSKSEFSLRQLFGREQIASEDGAVSKNVSASTFNLPPWQLSLMHAHDSSSEDEREEKKPVADAKWATAKTKTEVEEGVVQKQERQSFFFFYDEKDERILAEGEKFRRMEDPELIRKRWQKQRSGLIQFYKSRRKETMKKQRLHEEAAANAPRNRNDRSTSSAKQYNRKK